jgi:hypothetical protein
MNEETKPPKVIWLQWFDEDGEPNEDEYILWCEDQMNETDIKYVIADADAPKCKECGSVATPAWSMFHKPSCPRGKPAPFSIDEDE